MGLGLAQVGEFAFVVWSLVLTWGLVSTLTSNVLVFVAMGSLVLTPQLLKLGLQWADRAPILDREIAIPPAAPRNNVPRAVVIGIGPLGSEVASQFEIKGYDACLVDLRSGVESPSFRPAGFPYDSGRRG